MTDPTNATPTPAAKPKKVKPKSRPDRWREAVAAAQKALETAKLAAEDVADAIEQLREIQGEFTEWRDGMSENLQNSPTGQLLETICDIDLEPDTNDLDAMGSAIDECEGAELPRGFGRD